MHTFTVLLVGVLFSCSTYLILQRTFVKMLFGFALLSHAANILIMSMSGNPIGKLSPIITDETLSYVDPVPQALTLTAIVIGFAVTGYLVVLMYRLYQVSGKTEFEDQ